MLSDKNAALTGNCYRVSITRDPFEIDEAQQFRAERFALHTVRDADMHDRSCDHVLIRDAHSNTIVCCFRMLMVDAAQINQSYAARYYDLAAFERFDGHMLELGRFCIDATRRDPDILRLAWSVLADVVITRDIKLLFGCSSFSGTDPKPYQDAFAYLYEHARAPDPWMPRCKSTDVFFFADAGKPVAETKRAFQQMPPLLRFYVGMGGWVSDHAVVDHLMKTLHVFTAVETAAIPLARQRSLRALRDAQL